MEGTFMIIKFILNEKKIVLNVLLVLICCCVPVSCATKRSSLRRLENIDENSSSTSWEAVISCAKPPETPTESMEFLARSWSVSAMELSKALSNSHVGSQNIYVSSIGVSSNGSEVHDDASSTTALNESVRLFCLA